MVSAGGRPSWARAIARSSAVVKVAGATVAAERIEVVE
jgi:hypothetical protein